jgi:hypothetical protein
MNVGTAELGLYLNADQAYKEIAKVEAAIKKSGNNIQKHYQSLGIYGIGQANGKPSVNTQPSFFEMTKYNDLIKRQSNTTLEHIKAQEHATRSLTGFHRTIDKLNTSLLKTPVKALQNANAAIGTTPVFSETAKTIAQSKANKAIFQELKQTKGILDIEIAKNKLGKSNLDISNKILDNDIKTLSLSEKKARAEERRAKKALRDANSRSSITPVSFGGIYATMLGAYAVTTPIRQQMSFEREAIIAAKNIDYTKIQAFGGIQSAIQSIIFDAFKDPKSNAVIFGLSPEKYASNVGVMIQAGVEPTLNKNGTVNKQSVKNLQEMAALMPFVTQVLEVNENTASEFISKAKNIFSFDYKNWKKTNPNVNDSEFVKLMIAYIGDLARKNPVKAEGIMSTLVGIGAGGSMAQLPLSFSAPLATMFLSQGYKPGVVGTIISKTVAGAYSHLTDPKKGIAHIADKKRMDEIYNSKGGDSKGFYGLGGDAGVTYYALSKVKEGMDNGKIGKAEANKLLDYINKGRLGFQRSAATGTLWKTLDTLEKDMLTMQAQNLGLQIHGKEMPEIKKMIEQSEVEKKVAALTTANMWERTKMAGQVASIAVGTAMAPSTNKFLDKITKFITGYSLDDAFANREKEGEKKWGGLVGTLTSEAGKTLIPLIMNIVLGLVGLQVLSMVKNFAGKYPPLAKAALGRFGNIPGIGKMGIGASILYNKINPNVTGYSALRNARKIGISSNDIRQNNKSLAGGAGALLGLGLMYGNDIMANSDGTIKGLKGIGGAIGSAIPNNAKAGISAMIDPTDMKNLVGLYLLTSGNKMLATAAAIHFSSQYFAASGKASYGNDYEEPASQVIMRAAAIGILMSGIKNPTLVAGAIAYLGLRVVGDLTAGYVSDLNNFKNADSKALEAASKQVKDTGKPITPQEMVELRKKQEEATIAGKVEKYIKEKFVNMITINIDKDGKVSTEGNADTKVKTNTNQPNFTPPRISSYL